MEALSVQPAALQCAPIALTPLEALIRTIKWNNQEMVYHQRVARWTLDPSTVLKNDVGYKYNTDAEKELAFLLHAFPRKMDGIARTLGKEIQYQNLKTKNVSQCFLLFGGF